MIKFIVPYKTALVLKEKGFDECASKVGMLNYYYGNKGELSSFAKFYMNDRISQNEGKDWSLYAPTSEHVICWFREKHNIDITIMPVFREKCGYDSFKRDGYTFTIMRIEPCSFLDWTNYNQCAEDRDEENKEFPEGERNLPPSFKDYYECMNKAIEVALSWI